MGWLRALNALSGLQELAMRYPIAIEIGTETASYGVVVPDLPGCFSAGDTLDEAVTAAAEAAAAWIDATLDAGDAVPTPSSIEAVRARPEYAGGYSGLSRWTRPPSKVRWSG